MSFVNLVPAISYLSLVNHYAKVHKFQPNIPWLRNGDNDQGSEQQEPNLKGEEKMSWDENVI